MRAANADRTPPAQYTTSGGLLVGEPVLDLRLEMAAGDVHGTVEGAGVVLVGLADVEYGGAIGDQRGRTLRVDLTDLRLGGGEQITERGHTLNPTCLVGISRRCWPTRRRARRRHGRAVDHRLDGQGTVEVREVLLRRISGGRLVDDRHVELVPVDRRGATSSSTSA